MCCASDSASCSTPSSISRELEAAGDAYERQVSEAVAADEETQAYVRELERRTDELEVEADLPSGDALAAELSRFLREHEERRRQEEEEDT